MAVAKKDLSMDRIRQAITGIQGEGSEDFEKLMLCVYNWLWESDTDLEVFAQFVEVEQK